MDFEKASFTVTEMTVLFVIQYGIVGYLYFINVLVFY